MNSRVNNITLDGAPAIAIKPYESKWWLVRRRDGKGGDVEYSEKAFINNINNGGNFES